MERGNDERGRGVFCKNGPFLPPGPHPTPKKLFSGLHAGPRRCVVVAGVAVRMSKACLAQAFLFWALTGDTRNAGAQGQLAP